MLRRRHESAKRAAENFGNAAVSPADFFKKPAAGKKGFARDGELTKTQQNVTKRNNGTERNKNGTKRNKLCGAVWDGLNRPCNVKSFARGDDGTKTEQKRNKTEQKLNKLCGASWDGRNRLCNVKSFDV